MKNYILLGLGLLIANLSFAQNARSRAEIFIQIEDRGSFTVYLDNESISSTKGKFRFYDVFGPSATLAIVQGNKAIFKSQLTIRPNERLLLNYSLRQGLRTITTLAMYRNGRYALDDFDGELDAYNTGIVPPRPNGNDQQYNFGDLLAQVKRAPFDDDKIKLIQIYTASTKLTTAQLAALLKDFMKDEQKLALIKSIPRAIADPQNTYLLKDSFTFNSSKEEFLAYLKSGPSRNRLLNQRDFEQLLASVKKEAFDDDKTKLILATIQSASPNTAQVTALLKTYSFEDKALNAAKLIYSSVSDPQRYYAVKEAFKFKSNEDALLDFINRQ